MVKVTSKVRKIGNSYGMLIPKALVDTEVLDEGDEYTWELVRKARDNRGSADGGFQTFVRGDVLSNDFQSVSFSGVHV